MASESPLYNGIVEHNQIFSINFHGQTEEYFFTLSIMYALIEFLNIKFK